MFERLLLLTIGQVNYDHDINFYEPLQALFPRVIRYNYLEHFQQVGVPAANREILALAEQVRPEVIPFITYGDQVYKSTLQVLGRSAITIAWFSDDHWRFDDYSRKWAPYLDYCVTSDRDAFERYTQLGFSAVRSQWAANPDYYYPRSSELAYDVTFVGGRQSFRDEFIDGLQARGIGVQTFGRGWGEYLGFEDMVRVFSTSRINLNMGAYWGGSETRTIKGRVFEVPMSGGLLLTDYVPGLEEYFEIGKEIVCYTDLDDAAEKIRYYLAHEEERKTIARAGYERARRDHTWERRLSDVFAEVSARHQADADIVREEEDMTLGPGQASTRTLWDLRHHAVLDVACSPGPGAIQYVIPASRNSVVLHDADDRLVCHSQQEQQRITAQEIILPFADHRFDVVLATDSLHNLTERGAREFLQEARRVLSPEGYLLGSTLLCPHPAAGSLVNKHHPYHTVLFTNRQLDRLLHAVFGGVRIFEWFTARTPRLLFLCSPEHSSLTDPVVSALLAGLGEWERESRLAKSERLTSWAQALEHQGHRWPALLLALTAWTLQPRDLFLVKLIGLTILGRRAWDFLKKSLQGFVAVASALGKRTTR